MASRSLSSRIQGQFSAAATAAGLKSGKDGTSTGGAPTPPLAGVGMNGSPAFQRERIFHEKPATGRGNPHAAIIVDISLRQRLLIVIVSLMIAAKAGSMWPIVGCAIVHRLGHLELGAASVAVAVSTPHRQAAFEAGQWLIDTLKEIVPIWKKENWTDGTSGWIHPGLEAARPIEATE